jgi:excisionase family DNA binding protein
MERYLTRREVADKLALSEATVSRLAKSGALPAVKIGGTRAVRYPETAVERLAKAPGR